MRLTFFEGDGKFGRKYVLLFCARAFHGKVGLTWKAMMVEPRHETGASGEAKPGGVTFTGGEKVSQSWVVATRTCGGCGA